MLGRMNRALIISTFGSMTFRYFIAILRVFVFFSASDIIISGSILFPFLGVTIFFTTYNAFYIFDTEFDLSLSLTYGNLNELPSGLSEVLLYSEFFTQQVLLSKNCQNEISSCGRLGSLYDPSSIQTENCSKRCLNLLLASDGLASLLNSD